jgi:hypothetical protein
VAPELAPRVEQGAVGFSEADFSRLFHQLNNQLGIILANAELLESRLIDETQRARASQVVAGALDAITTIQSLRQMVGDRAFDR